MDRHSNQDWWRDQISEAISDFMIKPNNANEARLRLKMISYRIFHEGKQVKSDRDEHEYAMDYR